MFRIFFIKGSRLQCSDYNTVTTGCKTNTVVGLNTVRREATRHFRNQKKKKEYLKTTIVEREINSTAKNVRDL